MTSAREDVSRIRQNTRRLVQLYQMLLNEKKALLDENYRLKTALEEQEKKVAELENNNLNLQVSRAFEGGRADSAALKKRLDLFIKEIDACIGYLKG